MTIHRWHFAFTITYHYIFPQLSMGLSLLIFILKTQALRGNPVANTAVRFWAKVLGITFVMGVVTGIPMEFQFGTNWSRFSAATGGIIGQTLAMEGVFAFFLESTFLYLLVFKEEKLGPRVHWLVSLLVFFGTWLSGYFIICTNAWMQHPVGYEVGPDGVYHLTSLSALLTNPWAIKQYMHVMVGTTICASFVMAGIGAYYLLRGQHQKVTRHFVRLAIIVGFIASVAAAFPTGDMQAKMVYKHQPVTFAAMEGHFHTGEGVSLVLIGQPNMEKLELDNTIEIPKLLSFLTYARWEAKIKGLTDFDRSLWPDNIPLLYYSYHIMAGLGSFFILVMFLGLIFVLKRKENKPRWFLWILMMAMPFPFIANTAGWFTAELGRQPWIIYGLMRTSEGYSKHVSAGNSLFTLIGFMGLYFVLSVLYFVVMMRLVSKGPDSVAEAKP